MKIIAYIFLLVTSFSCIQSGYAQESDQEDLYSECVDHMISENQLESINNAVVDACSEQTQAIYQKQIVNLLDRIRKQSNEYQQPERYQKIMKSQQLWKAYVDQECQNAGEYIGSPMYSFCPMSAYKSRVEELAEYAQ